MEQEQKQSRLTAIFAAPLYLHDRVQEACDDFFISIGRSLIAEYHDAVTRYRASGRSILQSLFVLAIVICVLLLIFEHYTVYEYAYNGRALGYVNSEETVIDLLDVAGEKLSGVNNVDITFQAGDNVTFRKVPAAQVDTDGADQVINKLTYMTDIEVNATGIYENGKLIMIAENDTMAQIIEAGVLANYDTPDKGMAVDLLEYKNELTTEPIEVLLSSISSRGRAIDLLTKGGTCVIQHIVKEEETIDSVAESYGVNPEDIYAEDNKTKINEVIPGDIVTMNKTIEPLTVLMQESGTKTEVIEFETEEKETDELYKGDVEVTQEGEDGRQKVTGTIYFENGVEVKRDIESTEITKKPVTEKILIGTSDRPKTAPTGTFAFPLHASYSYTSGFGARWGSVHKGVDLACPTGTQVYASDGGKVIRASWFSGYGNCIDVEHKDGTFTRYGHLSAYDVSVGDEVYQGQEIGKVGSTGWSTGPHLHFEIHPNGGSAVDPAPYIGLS